MGMDGNPAAAEQDGVPLADRVLFFGRPHPNAAFLQKTALTPGVKSLKIGWRYRRRNLPMTEKERLEKRLWYDANNDPELLELRLKAEELCFAYNQTPPRDTARREELLGRLLPYLGKQVTILSPFYADYGSHCRIGSNTFINHNAYLMDCAPITIGTYCFIGPNCGMYTALHPLAAEDRNRGLEKAKPIVIGDNVWIGGNVTILPGVQIGSGSVIGAGSVVTKDIPENVVAVGNPCRVLRPITEKDRLAAGDWGD